jgi:hypothetical protein
MTTITSYAIARQSKFANLIARLKAMSPEQIKREITGMRSKAHSMPPKRSWGADQLRIMANDAENHFFLVLNPGLACGENLAHAMAHNLPLP